MMTMMTIPLPSKQFSVFYASLFWSCVTLYRRVSSSSTARSVPTAAVLAVPKMTQSKINTAKSILWRTCLCFLWYTAALFWHRQAEENNRHINENTQLKLVRIVYYYIPDSAAVVRLPYLKYIYSMFPRVFRRDFFNSAGNEDSLQKSGHPGLQ